MTVLIIGGAHQGKRALATRLFSLHGSDFVDGETCSLADIQAARAVNGLHRYTRRQTGWDAQTLLDTLQGKIVLCDEIGCGVVPFEKAQDDWREQTGRLLCDLAARADLVVRVYAGIGQAIKGQLPKEP